MTPPTIKEYIRRAEYYNRLLKELEECGCKHTMVWYWAKKDADAINEKLERDEK